MHCGLIILNLVNGLVVSETNNFKEEVVNIDHMNMYIKKGWMKYGWNRIIAASMSCPNAGGGREEEFMMLG